MGARYLLEPSSNNHGLRYVSAEKVVGLFYDSRSNQIHLASYVPYKDPPNRTLCGRYCNFSPVGGETLRDLVRPRCSKCWEGLDGGTV